ncbi:MAG: hypothetical protein ABI251_04015 [Mycobacteriaceae bacterium]
MSRTLAALDRLLLLVLGLIAVIVGVGAVVWDAELWDRLRGTVPASWLTRASGRDWWPWAVGAAGVVLAVLGLCWLLAHVSRHQVAEARLSGSSPAGKLTADLGALSAAAATAVLDTPGVRSASGKAVNDRGRRTLQLTVTIDPTADLATVVAASDRVCHDSARALGDPDVAARVHVRTARNSRSGPRVA